MFKYLKSYTLSSLDVYMNRWFVCVASSSCSACLYLIDDVFVCMCARSFFFVLLKDVRSKLIRLRATYYKHATCGRNIGTALKCVFACPFFFYIFPFFDHPYFSISCR